ncbi:Multicomponent K+:H+ antiporter subunit F OS=Castellaniella defragrans OX=75697 GN=HNR28_003569 PE=3 SV=1 [Castellaniella defragrans]
MNALILNAAVGFALLCFTGGLACAGLRLIRGPTAEDRILALDTVYINGMLILLVLGLRFEAGLYFDVALLIALFGFAGSAALAKFLLRGEVIAP